MFRDSSRPNGSPAITSHGWHHRLNSEQWVPAPLEKCFAFFAAPENLETLTPPFLRFQILTPLPIDMRAGALIDYRITLTGVPMIWRTRIEDWQDGRSFTDVQLRGPYARWIHHHQFEAGNGGTWIRDRVDYALFGGPLSSPLHAWFVRPRLERIFAYRREAIAARFGE